MIHKLKVECSDIDNREANEQLFKMINDLWGRKPRSCFYHSPLSGDEESLTYVVETNEQERLQILINNLFKHKYIPTSEEYLKVTPQTYIVLLETDSKDMQWYFSRLQQQYIHDYMSSIDKLILDNYNRLDTLEEKLQSVVSYINSSGLNAYESSMDRLNSILDQHGMETIPDSPTRRKLN